MIDSLRAILLHSQPLLLFTIIGLGVLIGQIRFRGFELGVIAVLFVGLAFGAWHPEGTPLLTIAPQVKELGLILFVYAMGLTCGPGFFSALRDRGLTQNAASLAAIALGSGFCLAFGLWLGLRDGQIAGVYCGALTSTPSLAATTQLLRELNPAATTDATVGYSLAYPGSVMVGLLLFQLLTSLRAKTFSDEKAQSLLTAAEGRALTHTNFEITNPEITGKPLSQLNLQREFGITLSRVKHDGRVFIPTKDTTLALGDVVLAVGKQRDVAKAEPHFGRATTDNIVLQSDTIEFRRILVSRRDLIGKTVGSLELDRRFNAAITRLRRADIEFVPTPETRLEMGDRLRVVMPQEQVAATMTFFGDSVRDLAELDITAMTVGICLGVLIGMIPVPLPGGAMLTLGFAGGPLVTALVLGKLGRTGPFVWSIPFEANNALRHIGLLFFLAAVGVEAGSRFGGAFSGVGLKMLILGALTTFVTVSAVFAFEILFAKTSITSAMGNASGVQTQPALLARGRQLSLSDETYVAYATVYASSMVAKIVASQLIVVGARWWI